jgi:hypothetical protein
MILEFYLVALSNMCQNFRIFCVCGCGRIIITSVRNAVLLSCERSRNRVRTHERSKLSWVDALFFPQRDQGVVVRARSEGKGESSFRGSFCRIGTSDDLWESKYM